MTALKSNLNSDGELIADWQNNELHLTLNRPERSNALSPSLVEALIAAFEQAAETDIRLVTLQGNGAHFCAGFDLANLAQMSDEILAFRLIRIETLLQLIAYAPHLTMVYAHGKTVGAGVDIVAAATHRIAAPETIMWMPGWQFDIALGTHRLLRRVGQSAALDYLIDGRRITAPEALRAGLLSQIEPWSAFSAATALLANRAQKMNPAAFKTLLSALSVGLPDQEMALLARSVAKPGIKNRIEAYIEKAKT